MPTATHAPCFVLIALASVMLATACDDDSADGRPGDSAGHGSSTTTGGGGDGGATGSPIDLPPAPPIAWSACTDADAPSFECADVAVPADWSKLDGPATSIRIRRQRAASNAPRGTLWMLEGGPGAPGRWMLPFAERTANAQPDLDVVVVDHRGTGGSGELLCDPPSDPPSSACLDALLAARGEAGIASVSASASAYDVAALARWFGRGDDQLLYGRSYGTYWAHRVVTLDPTAFSALVLDSPCSAIDGCPASRRDAQIDVVGRAFLTMCDADASCAARLPGGAETFAETVVASADAHGCGGADAAGLTGIRLRKALWSLAGPEQRALVPAILHRYARCNTEDVDALTHLVTYLDAIDEAVLMVPDLSLPTNYHVMRSDFWDSAFTVPQAEAQLAGTILSSGASLRWAKAFADWPWMPVSVDPALHAWHVPSYPVLVLVGGLDSATPPQQVDGLTERLAPGSTLVRLELAGHVASAGETPSGACARELLDTFFADPNAALDTSCAAIAAATERAALFDVPSHLSLTFLGTADAYD